MRALSIAALGLLTFATAARADGPYEGEWRASTRQIGIEPRQRRAIQGKAGLCLV